MAKNFGQIRIYNGKTFRLVSVATKLSQARAIKRYYQNRGRRVRIAESISEKRGLIYGIYIR